ncbi:hypothetical protein Peur_015669 [Populus x canadensis]
MMIVLQNTSNFNTQSFRNDPPTNKHIENDCSLQQHSLQENDIQQETAHTQQEIAHNLCHNTSHSAVRYFIPTPSYHQQPSYDTLTTQQQQQQEQPSSVSHSMVTRSHTSVAGNFIPTPSDHQQPSYDTLTTQHKSNQVQLLTLWLLVHNMCYTKLHKLSVVMPLTLQQTSLFPIPLLQLFVI